MAAFGVRVTGVAYGPDRAMYELSRPAYVVVISVTDKAIHPVSPSQTITPALVGSGMHAVALDPESRGDIRGVSLNAADGSAAVRDESAAGVMEYNRCLARARQESSRRREARRPIIGRDSLGRPIYGPPPTLDEPGVDLESRCRMPVTERPQAAMSAQRPAVSGRQLLIFASDTPVEYRDIIDLVITEGDPRSVAAVIGRKLYDIRGARWSATYLPW